jgi:hypothetical protein
MSNDVWTEARFWAQVSADSERTVICSPDLESRVKGWVDARNLAGLIKVQATPICPDNTLWVLDHHAVEASMREALSHPIQLRREPPRSLLWPYTYRPYPGPVAP